MRNRSWKFIVALAAVIVLVSVVGSYEAEADGSRLVYVEADGYLMPSGFMTRSDVKFRHSFKKGFSAKMGPKALKELSKMDGITFSDVPILYPSVPADQTPYGIEQIYDDPGITSTSGGAGITIAHLDTGVFTGHPDLTDRIVGCLDATNGMANGCTDTSGHGTHTAGTAVADGGADGTGVFGVAPEADLFVIKVCGGGCAADDVAAAINHIGNNNLADIVTMSFGGDSSIGLISDAIESYPGILFVAAAGNDGPSGGTIDFPASDPNVVAVGAIDDTLTVINKSSRGIDDGDDSVVTEGEVEFVAAGDTVLSTFNDGGYRYGTGTSMSTPHVAGLAAREWQSDAASTRAFLRGSAEDIISATGGGAEPGYDIASGYGLPHVTVATPPPDVTLDSIQVSPSSPSIMVGEDQQFSATALYSDSTQADITGSATWDSSNDAVATIDGSGLASGVTEGNTSITAKLDGVTSNIASLEVTLPPEVTLDSIQVSPSSASIAVGEDQQFSATAFYSDGAQADVTGSATWDSSNDAVATIDGSGLASGVSEGNTSITATLDGVTSNIASLEVTAPPPPPTIAMVHVADLDSRTSGGKRGWRTTIKILVMDSEGNAVSGASVSGTWAPLGAFSCTTKGNGSCRVRSGNISLSTSGVMFEVGNVIHSTMEYDPDSNEDPDGDSDGTVILIDQPTTSSNNSK